MQRVALVTGSNRGIGLAIATGLAGAGYRVLLTARQMEQAQAAASPLQERGLVVDPHQLDVTDPRSITALVERVESAYGRLDALVNNAGAYYDKGERASQTDADQVAATLDVNLLGPWRMCHGFLPLMRRQQYGRIVNLSSGLGSFAETGRGAPAYSVSKAALNMLTLKLARELAGSGILINACCPGWVRTEMGGPEAPRTVAEGADTPIWLATLADDGPTGGFFRDRQPIPW